MKNVMIICMLFVAVAMNAQTPKSEKNEARLEKREKMKNLTPEQRADLRVKKMTEKLQLTEVQQTQLRALYLEKSKKRMAVRETRKEDKAAMSAEQLSAMRAKKMEQKAAYKSQMKAILTEAQYATWESELAKKGKSFEHKDKKGNRKSAKDFN